MRRTALALSALLGLSALTAASPAQAVGSCTITTPSKVIINQEYKEHTLTFSGSCTTGDGWGWWELVHPTKGSQDMWLVQGGSYTNGAKQVWEIYDYMLPTGTMTVRPQGAYDANGNELPQNTRYVTAKLGSRTSLTTSRSGSTVYLSGRVSYYSPSSSAYKARSGATVKFYSRNSDGSWTYRKSATTNSYGYAKTSLSSSTTKVWKAVMVEQSNIWGSTSATSTR